MDQEKITPAPEEQFDGQQPEENDFIENGTVVTEPVADEPVEPVLDEPVETVADEPVEPEVKHQEVKDTPVSQHYSSMSLPELLLEFDRLLNQKDSTALMRHAEMLKSFFYKGLRKERGEEPIPEIIPVLPEGVEEAEEVDFVETIQDSPLPDIIESGSGEPSLYVEEENAFKRMYAKYKTLRTEFMKQQELQKEQNLQSKQAIIDELKILVEKQEDLNHTFPEFRALQARWKEVGPVPVSNTKDIWDTYQHYVEKFYDYVKINNELRDLDFKKNLEQKTQLCEKAEELLLVPNILSAFNKLQKLHEEWRESGPVAREHREQIWDRFKATTSEINKRHQAYFEAQKEVQKKNFEEKTALCEKAEEIAAMEPGDATDWNRRSKAVENLQKKWRTIGFASKRENQKVYDRFRAACNKFYESKRHFYLQYKGEMQDNLTRKLSLCEQAEALQNSEEWRRTSDLLVNLQRQWKEIGPVARRQSDQIWKRFRTACDTFFENKAKHFNSIDDNYEKNLKKKEALIEEVRRFEPSNNHHETLAALKDFQRRWGEIGFVPIKEKERIHSTFTQVMDTCFNALRNNEGARKPNKPKRRMDEVHTNGKQERTFRSEREKLLFKFRQMEADIALWENNMGFFAKSKNADNLIAEMERKIITAKEELLVIEEKIKTMDKQFDNHS